MGELPRIKARIEGRLVDAELIAYVDTRHGRMARLCWYDRIGDSDPVPHTVTLPEAWTYELPGVDYGDVPVITAEQQRGGRVATGHEWRRTG